jgi:hypothetical protein
LLSSQAVRLAVHNIILVLSDFLVVLRVELHVFNFTVSNKITINIVIHLHFMTVACMTNQNLDKNSTAFVLGAAVRSVRWLQVFSVFLLHFPLVMGGGGGDHFFAAQFLSFVTCTTVLALIKRS